MPGWTGGVGTTGSGLGAEIKKTFNAVLQGRVRQFLGPNDFNIYPLNKCFYLCIFLLALKKIFLKLGLNKNFLLVSSYISMVLLISIKFILFGNFFFASLVHCTIRSK